MPHPPKNPEISWILHILTSLLLGFFACVFSDFLWFSPPSARSKGKGELSPQAVQSTDTAQTAQTDPNSGPKKRKTFDKMELAAMDTVYKASKGLPTSSMIERLTSSLGLEKDQVLWCFINVKWVLKLVKFTSRLGSFHIVFIVKYPTSFHLMNRLPWMPF